MLAYTLYTYLLSVSITGLMIEALEEKEAEAH
jgi:hypothetical protein